MRYYETDRGLYACPDVLGRAPVLPAGARELTASEYAARLEVIREEAALRAEAEEAPGEDTGDHEPGESDPSGGEPSA